MNFNIRHCKGKLLHTVIHDGGGDVLAGDSLGPGRLHVQVQLGLASVLSRVLQVPLEGKVRVCGVSLGSHVGYEVLHLERVITSLYPLEPGHLDG